MVLPLALLACPLNGVIIALQVHLALTGDPSQMRVSWRTDGEG